MNLPESEETFEAFGFRHNQSCYAFKKQESRETKLQASL